MLESNNDVLQYAKQSEDIEQSSVQIESARELSYDALIAKPDNILTSVDGVV